MKAVLVVVLNGNKVVDSGTGVVFAKEARDSSHPSRTWVITCAHTLRSLRGHTTTSPFRIKVDGIGAMDVPDDLLAKYDLAVLRVEGDIEDVIPAKLRTIEGGSAGSAAVRCLGFSYFHQNHFEIRTLAGKIDKRVQAVMADGIPVEYIKIKPRRGSDGFTKGFSGGPICDKNGDVVAISRILELPNNSSSLPRSERIPDGYGIVLSRDILKLIDQKLPPGVRNSTTADSRNQGTAIGAGRSLDAAPPKPPLIKIPEDPQKSRWGGRSEGFGFRFKIENVREYRRYFSFDAVLEKSDTKGQMEGPFIFHLHDTFDKSIIWVRKVLANRAVLEEIATEGTFTLGVQFRDAKGTWRGLEYDLVKYKKGALEKYDA